MAKQYRNLIGGEMIETGEWLDVVNPASEDVIGQVPACGQGELDRAVAAARAAFKTWRKTSLDERREAIKAIAGAIKENGEELFRLLTSEQGKPHAQAQQEIYGAAGMASSSGWLRLASHSAMPGRGTRQRRSYQRLKGAKSARAIRAAQPKARRSG